MESLEQDVNNCLIFLIANQAAWKPSRVKKVKTKRSVTTLVIGHMADGTVVAPGRT